MEKFKVSEETLIEIGYDAARVIGTSADLICGDTLTI